MKRGENEERGEGEGRGESGKGKGEKEDLHFQVGDILSNFHHVANNLVTNAHWIICAHIIRNCFVNCNNISPPHPRSINSTNPFHN